MPSILAFDGGDTKVVLSYEVVDANVAKISSVTLSYQQSNAELKLSRQVTLDARLFKPDATQLGYDRFLTEREIADLHDASLLAARDALRRELSEFDVEQNSLFFGAKYFGGAQLQASARITLPVLFDDLAADQPIVVARAFAKIKLANDEQKEEGRAQVTIKLRATGDPRAAIEVIADKFKELGLQFAETSFPSLNLNGLQFNELRAPRFSFGGPFGRLALDWRRGQDAEAPAFRLAVNGGALTLTTTTPGVGVLVAWSSSAAAPIDLAWISDFRIKVSSPDGGNTVIDLVGTFVGADHTSIELNRTYSALSDAYRIVVRGKFTPDVQFDSGRVVRLGGVTEIKSLLIEASGDATSAVEVALKITSTWTIGADPSHTISDFQVLRPTPLQIANGLLAYVDGLARINFDVPAFGANFSAVAALLRAIGRLLAAAAQFAASGLSLLARALMALLDVLARGLERLIDAAGALRIEIYLDDASFGLRQVRVIGKRADTSHAFSAGGLILTIPSGAEIGLLVAFENEEVAAVAIVADPGNLEPEKEFASLSTDLWLKRPDDTVEAARSEPDAPASTNKLVDIKISRGNAPPDAILAVAAMVRGEARFFAKTALLRTNAAGLGFVRGPIVFSDLTIGDDPTKATDIAIKIDVDRDRALPFLAGGQNKSAGGIGQKLSQYVRLDSEKKPETRIVGQNVEIDLPVIVMLRGFASEENSIKAPLRILINARKLTARVSSPKQVAIRGTKSKHKMFGLDLDIVSREKPDDPAAEFAKFHLDFSDGDPRLSLSEEAKATLSYTRLTRGGQRLKFDISVFRVARSGVDLSAKIAPDPVLLSGVNTPFSFTSGEIVVVQNDVVNATLVGSGQLPPKLVGDATAEVSINLGRRGGSDALRVLAAQGALTTKKPLVCEGTRFRFRIDELGFDFRDDDGEHFFFLLTGEAQFKPTGGEFASGILKHLANTKIALRRAPLAGDAKVLARHISFQTAIDPPAQTTLFNIFKFELKGVGFHPASPAFSDRPPAISISGQAHFTPGGDAVNAKIDFHQLWIAPPKDKALPRFRFDGLGVELRAASAFKISGMALAVDTRNTPALNEDGSPLFASLGQQEITEEGFLAKVRVEMASWAPMAGTFGALELREVGDDGSRGRPRHAFFAYGQGAKLCEPFSLFGYTVYLQEVGFGVGFRYTLAGIAEADRVTTPQHLVRTLDDISKRQGNLGDFAAWQPEPEGDRVTLAMRAMFSMTSASAPGSWNDKAEKSLAANPLLFDVVAALRSDLTLLMTGRLWLCTTYYDWVTAAEDADWKSKPSLRGYLYLSIPRRILLARALADGTGVVGEKPRLMPEFKAALERIKWSSTLYIAPGIFHAEIGWPYEIEFSMGDQKSFGVTLQGGAILRIEDGAVLYGFAFRGIGFATFEGKVGGRRFGARAVARVDFALDAKLIAYISSRNVNDTLFYGAIKLDVTIGVRVEVWLEFKIFRKRIRLEIRFSFRIALSVAVELCLQPNGVGGRARASITVRGFGRSLTLGIGFSFNDGKLNDARARVARFMTLGLGANYPDPATSITATPAPRPEVARKLRAEKGDRHLTDQSELLEYANSVEGPAEDEPIPVRVAGRPITHTDYWAVIQPMSPAAAAKATGEHEEGNDTRYLLYFIPRDHTGAADDQKRASFFASPRINAEGKFDHILVWTGEAAPPALKPVRRDNDTDPQDWVLGGVWPRSVRWDRVLVEEADERITLADVFEEMFMGRNDPYKYTEPSARLIDVSPESPEGSDEAIAERLAVSARQRAALPLRSAIECEVDERRSAYIGALGESAAMFAETGGGGAREGDLRDLGLAFVIDETALKALFADNADKKLKIQTRVSKYDASPDWNSGTVTLLNPPTTFFRTAQPHLINLATELTPQGVKLYWDLEAGWAADTPETHPEYHLRHYRVERVIRGLRSVRPFTTTFLVGDCAELKSKSATPAYRTLRVGAQYTDDLADLGPELAAAILGRPSEKSPSEAWDNAGIGDAPISLIYAVTPVDIAGTAADPTVLELEIPRPQEIRQAVKHARLDIRFECMPELRRAEAPTLRLTVFDSDQDVANTLHLARSRRRRTEGRATPNEGPFKYELKVLVEEMTEIGRFADDIDLAQPGENAPGALYELVIAQDVTGPDEIELALLWPRAKGGFEETVLSAKIIPLLGALPFAEQFGLLAPRTDAPRRASRLMIRPVKDSHPKAIAGPWTPVDLVLLIGRPDEATGEPPISAPVQKFEHPMNVRFKALDFEDLYASAGRAFKWAPSPDATVENFEDNASLLRDPERRTAIKIRWSAHPITLTVVDNAAGGARPHFGLIGGFDLFTHEFQFTDRSLPGETRARRLARQARRLGRIELLPAGLNMDPPFETGAFNKIEAAYPSDTVRHIASAGARRAAWFSNAESVVCWPKWELRYQLVPTPDEADISAVFAKGAPSSLRAVLATIDVDGVRTEGDSWLLGRPTITPAQVREWLLSLRALNPLAETKTYVLDLHHTVAGAEFLAASIPITFTAGLHGVLEETIAELQWEDGSPRYRRYELSLEPRPSTEAKTPLEFFAEFGPDADPYGWGAMRALGLAASFRLFDTETDRHLSGMGLLEKVDAAFRKVLSRYAIDAEDAADFGAPFVDLLYEPDSLIVAGSYDGGAPNADRSALRASASLIQISLRPTAAQLFQGDQSLDPVFYVELDNIGADGVIDLSKLPAWASFAIFDGEYVVGGPAAGSSFAGRTGGGGPLKLQPNSAALVRMQIVAKGNLSWERVSRCFINMDATLRPTPRAISNYERDAFGRFDALAPREWRRLLRGEVGDDSQAIAPPHELGNQQMRRLRALLRRFVEIDDARWDSLSDPVFDSDQFFAALMEWQARFFEHGAGALRAGMDTVSVAFATTPQPDPWRRRVAADGTIEVTIFEKDRWAHQRSFAVRPFGRYEALSTALDADGAASSQIAKGPDLLDALDERELTAWATVDTPRTESVPAPVILSARRLDEVVDGVDRSGRTLELVVARPSDETLADSNLVVDALVQSHGCAVGLWRELPSRDWAEAAWTHRGRPGGAFIDLPEVGDWKLKAPNLDLKIAESVGRLAQTLPELWRGALVYRFDDLPYFYRIHALVFAASGVVVSNINSAAFPEGAYDLALPKTVQPSWSLKRTAGGQIALEFKIPLSRFFDNMRAVSQSRWAPGVLSCESVFATPDPVVSYRLSVEMVDGQNLRSIAAEVEIRPNAACTPASPNDAMYFCTSVGQLFAGSAITSQMQAKTTDPTVTLLVLKAAFPHDHGWVPVTSTDTGAIAQVVATTNQFDAVNPVWALKWPDESVANFRAFVEFASRLVDENPFVADLKTEAGRISALATAGTLSLDAAIKGHEFLVSGPLGLSPSAIFPQDLAPLAKPVAIRLIAPLTDNELESLKANARALHDEIRKMVRMMLHGANARFALEAFRAMAKPLRVDVGEAP